LLAFWCRPEREAGAEEDAHETMQALLPELSRVGPVVPEPGRIDYVPLVDRMFKVAHVNSVRQPS
jgi:hypothetical protein